MVDPVGIVLRFLIPLLHRVYQISFLRRLAQPGKRIPVSGPLPGVCLVVFAAVCRFIGLHKNKGNCFLRFRLHRELVVPPGRPGIDAGILCRGLHFWHLRV